MTHGRALRLQVVNSYGSVGYVTGYIYIGLEKYWLLVRNIIEALKSIPGGVTVLLYETFQVTPD